MQQKNANINLDKQTNSMTPKEKARELIDKMKFNCRECDNDFKAKQCALIAVDEILKIVNEYSAKNMQRSIDVIFWEEVKQELEQL